MVRGWTKPQSEICRLALQKVPVDPEKVVFDLRITRDGQLEKKQYGHDVPLVLHQRRG